MCVIAVAWHAHPRWRLVVAANRDEYFARPSAPLAAWEIAPQVLAGRDLEAGGTWLGLTKSGRFAAVTNFRDPNERVVDARSRGELVSSFLRCEIPAAQMIANVRDDRSHFRGFTLLVADQNECWRYESRADLSVRLDPGIYAISNGASDAAWPKVVAAREGLHAALQTDDIEAQCLTFLQDRRFAADMALPNTGVGIERARA